MPTLQAIGTPKRNRGDRGQSTRDNFWINPTNDVDVFYTQVKFGVLFKDETCANTFEALNGTLRAAKKRKKLTFQGDMLLQGVSDDVDITLLE